MCYADNYVKAEIWSVMRPVLLMLFFLLLLVIAIASLAYCIQFTLMFLM